MVVLYHCARHVNQEVPVPALTSFVQFGHAGVDLFFVLSGFIILFVHEHDIGCPRRALHYAERRASRVMPTYWVALAVTLGMMTAGGHHLPGLGGLIMAVTLLPSDKPPILGVAWTLQFELMFYFFFAVLICNARVGWLLLAAWTTAMVAATGLLAPTAPPVLRFLCGAYNFEFLMGMAVAWHTTHFKTGRPRHVAAAGVCLLGMAAFAEDRGWMDGYAATARLFYGVPAALFILGAVALDIQGKLNPPRLLLILGKASYSIYLFQFVFIGAVWKILLALGLDQSMPAWFSFAVLVAATLTGGVLAAAYIERPMLRLIRNGFPVRTRAAT